MNLITLLETLKGEMTVEEFANKLGAPKTSVERVLYGQRNAGVRFLRRVATTYPLRQDIRRAIVEYIYQPEG